VHAGRKKIRGNVVFKVIRSDIEIAVLRRRLLDCIQIWYRVSSCRRWYTTGVQGQRAKGHRLRSQHKVMYQQQKCYNVAVDRFSDFEVRTCDGVVIKAEKDWHGIRWPQVAMHSHLPRFLVVSFHLIAVARFCSLHVSCYSLTSCPHMVALHLLHDNMRYSLTFDHIE